MPAHTLPLPNFSEKTKTFSFEELHEKLKPVEQRLRAAAGELIVVVERQYQPFSPQEDPLCTFIDPGYAATENLYCALATHATHFPRPEEVLVPHRALVHNVDHAHEIMLPGKILLRLENPQNIPSVYHPFNTLYHRNEPPSIPEWLIERKNYRALSNKPRFELYCGDAEALNYLQTQMAHPQLIGLDAALHREMPYHLLKKTASGQNELSLAQA